MLNRLFRSRRAEVVPQAAIPPGQRIYAIGDIHGRLDLLDQLLDLIGADDTARGRTHTRLIFLGDLIDRGLDSRGVVERLRQLSLASRDASFLLGNHEEIFLKALDGDLKSLKFLCRFGGRETILSYGIEEGEYEAMDWQDLATALDAVVPAEHRDFLRGFEDLIEVGDYAFVHAGIRPETPLAEQRTSDLRWIREPFLNHPAPLEKLIVHGHTITDEVEFRPHRIGIDTGAYASGRLTALGLEGVDQWLLHT